MGDALGLKFQQIVVATTNQVALNHLRHRLDVTFKVCEVGFVVILQRDLSEYRCERQQLAKIQLCVVADDVTFLLESLYSCEARAR